MNHWLLIILLFPVLLTSELTQESSAPLLALEPQLQLYLTDENRQVLIADQQIAENARNVHILREHAFPWQLLLALSVLALAIWLILNYRQQKKLSEIIIQSQQQKAEQALQNINKKKGKEFYVEAADLCLAYLKADKIFAIDEIDALIDKMNLSNKEKWRYFLKLAFMVKFAKEQPSEHDCQEAYQLASDLISK